ncbi:MAG: N-acyl-D-amino acid deacylase, partial [Myxococcota bacterium]
MEATLHLQGGLIADGSGRELFPGDVAIDGGRITAVIPRGTPAPGGRIYAREVLDVRGRVVAPGFIDIHSHSDWVLPQRNHGDILKPLLEQGVTTLVTGNCG